MGAVVENTAAQWGAIGLMLLSGGWLVRYLTGRLAVADARREKREDELLEAYRENTAALTSFTEALRELRR